MSSINKMNVNGKDYDVQDRWMPDAIGAAGKILKSNGTSLEFGDAPASGGAKLYRHTLRIMGNEKQKNVEKSRVELVWIFYSSDIDLITKENIATKLKESSYKLYNEVSYTDGETPTKYSTAIILDTSFFQIDNPNAPYISISVVGGGINDGDMTGIFILQRNDNLKVFDTVTEV